jgi:hypothetical protein
MTARKIAAVIASLWLAACMGAGTGTDTENGIDVSARVLSAEGAPMANVEVRVHALDAGPENRSADPLMPETGVLRTDGDGYVRFAVRRAGTYMAEGLRGDTVLLLDTLTVKKSDTSVFHAAGVKRLRGTVRLYSGYRIDTGFVFVRGSSIAAAVNRDGEYDFGYVPANASAMTLGARYDAGPVSQVFVKLADAGSAPVIDARFALDTSLVPNGTPTLTLFKASQSATNVCLDESSRQMVVPGISLRGSLGTLADVRRAAGYACSQNVGAKIDVEETTADGKSKQKLGDYVLPDTEIWPVISKRAQGGLGSTTKGQKIVVPLSCLTSGKVTTYTTVVAQDSTGAAQIRVDDVKLDGGCEF